MKHFDKHNKKSDIDIITSIITDKDNDIAIREKLYNILYESSLIDSEYMDTDLIKECVETLNLVEGDNEQLSSEKIEAMKQNIDTQYKKWYRSKGVIQPILKKTAIIIICLFMIFSLTNTIAYAFGYNFIQIITNWGSDTFNLSLKNTSSDMATRSNVSARTTAKSIEEIIKDIEPKPLLPKWLQFKIHRKN